jgi:thiamine biosynthesis lipoprotein
VTDELDPTVSATWRALGTGVHLVVSRGPLEPARHAVEAMLDRVDRTYSRFRDDSELSRLNRRSAERTVISDLLVDAIAVALAAARRTGGAVDPTVGRAMRAIGYDTDFEAIAQVGAPTVIRLEPIPGWQAVELSLVRHEVVVRNGVELDLGSTGKGLAADLAAGAALDALAPANADAGVLVSLGGDIATAGLAPGDGWRILVAEDSETPTEAAGEVISITSGAVATSSTTVRRWRRGDRTIHHLIDPRTGGPVESPWRTASVAAASCAEANTAATAAIVMAEDALVWLERSRLPARLVSIDGAITRLNGWPVPVTGTA